MLSKLDQSRAINESDGLTAGQLAVVANRDANN